jgi:hypothetical protein
VGLEQRIVIGAEMSRCVLTMDGGVEHPADVGAIDGTTMHAASDEATSELLHDHEHPVAPEHDGEGYRVVLPVAAFFTWHGTNLEGSGLTPDIAEPADAPALMRGVDTQLTRAVEAAHSLRTVP